LSVRISNNKEKYKNVIIENQFLHINNKIINEEKDEENN